MANEGLRVGILGGSVDDPVDDSNPNWTTGGPAADRNALTTDERIITRVVNFLDERVDETFTATEAFDERFNDVVGEDSGADVAAFAAIGKKLIPAIADLMADEPPADDLL